MFLNNDGKIIEEKNPSHMTDPYLTFWFIGRPMRVDCLSGLHKVSRFLSIEKCL